MSNVAGKPVFKMPVPIASSTPKYPTQAHDRPFWFNKFQDHTDLNEWVKSCDEAFFYGQLRNRLQIGWNGNMSSTAGKCWVRRSKVTGELYAKILLSGPLLKQNKTNQFAETLIHEMIHAYVGLVDKPRKMESDKGHGPLFLGHMDRINAMTGLKITVRHRMYEEMHAARPYWWACDGPCRLWPPYHGLLKKSNKAPITKMELAHHKECPGTFHRIKVPTPSEKPVKAKSAASSTGRPSLVVRKSLMIPTPISKKDIFIVPKRPVHPPTPRTAQASLNYLRLIKCPIPETALKSQLTARPPPALRNIYPYNEVYNLGEDSDSDSWSNDDEDFGINYAGFVKPTAPGKRLPLIDMIKSVLSKPLNTLSHYEKISAPLLKVTGSIQLNDKPSSGASGSGKTPTTSSIMPYASPVSRRNKPTYLNPPAGVPAKLPVVNPAVLQYLIDSRKHHTKTPAQLYQNTANKKNNPEKAGKNPPSILPDSRLKKLPIVPTIQDRTRKGFEGPVPGKQCSSSKATATVDLVSPKKTRHRVDNDAPATSKTKQPKQVQGQSGSKKVDLKAWDTTITID